jgi:hypothetical protein
MGRREGLAGAAHLMLADGALLDPQRAVFEAMLAGWERQQQARLLTDATSRHWLGLVRRFQAFTDDSPWVWQASDVEECLSWLRSCPQGRAVSTLRDTQVCLRRLQSRSPSVTWLGLTGSESRPARQHVL